MRVDDLTQEVITASWRAYCKAANRHGVPPKLAVVLDKIKVDGVFEVITGSNEHWTTRFVIKSADAGYEITVLGNKARLASHQKLIDAIVQQFNSLV